MVKTFWVFTGVFCLQVLTCAVNLVVFRAVSGGPSVKGTSRAIVDLHSPSMCGYRGQLSTQRKRAA